MQYINDTPLKTNHVPWNSMVFHMYSLLKSSLWKRASILVLRRVFFRLSSPNIWYISFWIKVTLGIKRRNSNRAGFGGWRIDGRKKNSRCWKKNPWKIDDLFHHFVKNLGEIFMRDCFFLGWAAWGSLKMESKESINMRFSKISGGCHPAPEITCWWCQRRVASRMTGT